MIGLFFLVLEMNAIANTGGSWFFVKKNLKMTRKTNAIYSNIAPDKLRLIMKERYTYYIWCVSVYVSTFTQSNIKIRERLNTNIQRLSFYLMILRDTFIFSNTIHFYCCNLQKTSENISGSFVVFLLLTITTAINTFFPSLLPI